MARTMYDSTDPYAIPANAEMVAGYIDGSLYRWPDAAWNRFSGVKVRIARRTYTNDGHVLDVEYGIPTVWPINNGIVEWVKRRRAAGIEPTIYCNQLNDWGPIRTLFDRAGVAQPQYWVARYNGVRDIPPGAVAKQFANPPIAGGHFDLSTVADYWPGVDQESFMAALSDAEQRELLALARVLKAPSTWQVQNWSLGAVLSAMRTVDIGHDQPETLHAKVSALETHVAEVDAKLDRLLSIVEGLQ